MRKIHILGLAVVAVVAINVIGASAASAEVALWLAAGLSITGTTTLATEATGLLDLTDEGAPSGGTTVNCEAILDGWVGSEGKDEITSVLTKAGVLNTNDLIECEVVSTKAGACETSMLANVEPIGLPWTTQLELMAAGAEEYLDIVTNAAKEIGYMVTCLTILGETLDTCTQAEGTQVLTNVTGGVNGASNETDTGNCTIGGTKKGSVAGSGVTTLVNKEALTVSME